MVHGDVREEREVLSTRGRGVARVLPRSTSATARSTATSSTGSTIAGSASSSWPIAILVPSEHIAATLARHGTPVEKLRVIPYAADTRRFRPDPAKRHGPDCTFLFAGGITQRKGIKYLLEAWRKVRRPGWKLQLLGALPRDPGPIRAYLDGVELLGRVAALRGPRADGGGRRLRVPVAVRRLGGRHLRGPRLRAAERRHAERGVGRARRGRRLPRAPGRRSSRWPSGWSGSGATPRFARRCRARPAPRAEEFDWPRYHAAVVDARHGSVAVAGAEGVPA